MVDPNEFFRSNLAPSSFPVERAKKRLRTFQAGQTGFISGLTSLDPYFRLLPGELTVIGGRAGSGKTALGLQMVHAVLAQLEQGSIPGQVAVFSAEMDGETLMLRETCALEKIPLWSIQTKSASDEEYDRIEKRLATLDNDRFLIDETSSPTLEHMIDQLEAAQERGSIKFVLFDYTELSGEFEKVESQRIAKISRGLKAIAKKYACPVLTLSQLNRDIESRPDKTPTMRDLMHGGEREPDRIMILLHPYRYNREEPENGFQMHVVKNRNGPMGEAYLLFDKTTMRFSSAERIRTNLNETEGHA